MKAETQGETIPFYEPTAPPEFGTLKQARLSRLVKYQRIKNEHVRVLQIIIDNGPICACLVAVYAGLRLKVAQSIIDELVSERINSVVIYRSQAVNGYEGTPIPLYHCPFGV